MSIYAHIAEEKLKAMRYRVYGNRYIEKNIYSVGYDTLGNLYLKVDDGWNKYGAMDVKVIGNIKIRDIEYNESGIPFEGTIIQLSYPSKARIYTDEGYVEIEQ